MKQQTTTSRNEHANRVSKAKEVKQTIQQLRPQLEKQTPVQTARKAWKACTEQYPEIKQWRFEIDTAKGRLGVCKYDKKLVTISQLCLEQKPENIIDTVLHEAAHAITLEGHTKKWREVFMAMGGSGKRTTPIDAKNYSEYFNKQDFKWMLFCKNNCTLAEWRGKDIYHIGYHRKPSSRLICPECTELLKKRMLR